MSKVINTIQLPKKQLQMYNFELLLCFLNNVFHKVIYKHKIICLKYKFNILNINISIYLAPWWCDNEIGIHTFLSELFRYVQSQRAVIVINVTFRGVAENRMRPIDFFELLRRLRVVWVLVWVVFQRQTSICLLDLLRRGGFRQLQDFVQRITLRSMCNNKR